MKALKNVVAVLVVLGLVGSAWAAADGAKKKGNRPAKNPPVAGKLEKIEDTKLTLKVKAEAKTITVDDKTTFKVDDKDDARLSDLKVGMQIKAVVVEGVVKSIEAKTPGQNKQPKGDKPAKKEKPAKQAK